MVTQHSKQLTKILKTLHDLHGVDVDLNVPVAEVREAYQEVLENKQRIIEESSFNNYFRDPDYTKHVLLAEAFRIFLSEIAPKRMRRRTRRRATNESAATKQGKEMKNTEATSSEEQLVNGIGDDKSAHLAEEQAVNEAADREVRNLRLTEQRDALAAKLEQLRRRLHESNRDEPSLVRLMEADLEQAEVMLAARSIGDDIQKMAENLASAQIEDLMPLVDRMKTEFGPEKAEAFNSNVQQALQAALDSVRSAKDSIDNGILALQGEGAVGGDMAAFPPGEEVAPPEGEEVPPPAEEPPPEGEAPPAGDEEAVPPEDEFAGDEAAAGVPEEPVGRAKKEESIRRRPALNEVVRNYDLPPEINSLIDDFEYYIDRRHLPMKEAQERSLRRYRRLYGENSLLPVEMVEKALNEHIAANEPRLVRQSKLNELKMPPALKEAVERVGLPEMDFRDHLRGFLGRAIRALPEPQFRTKLEEIAGAIEKDPDSFVKRMIRLAEKREMAELSGYAGYRGFRRSLLDNVREKRIDLSEMAKKLNENERDVFEVSRLHEMMPEQGLLGWYNSPAFRHQKVLRRALKRIDSPTAEHLSGLVERALSVIEQYRNEHGEIDQYGREMLNQLDRRYESISRDVEQALTEHLYKAAA